MHGAWTSHPPLPAAPNLEKVYGLPSQVKTQRSLGADMTFALGPPGMEIERREHSFMSSQEEILAMSSQEGEVQMALSEEQVRNSLARALDVELVHCKPSLQHFTVGLRVEYVAPKSICAAVSPSNQIKVSDIIVLFQDFPLQNLSPWMLESAIALWMKPLVTLPLRLRLLRPDPGLNMHGGIDWTEREIMLDFMARDAVPQRPLGSPFWPSASAVISQQKADMSVTLGLDFKVSILDSQGRQVFIEDLQNDLANASGLRPSNFNVIHLESGIPGSIVVDIGIEGIEGPEAVARGIQSQINNPKSILRSGSVTRFTQSIRVESDAAHLLAQHKPQLQLMQNPANEEGDLTEEEISIVDKTLAEALSQLHAIEKRDLLEHQEWFGKQDSKDQIGQNAAARAKKLLEEEESIDLEQLRIENQRLKSDRAVLERLRLENLALKEGMRKDIVRQIHADRKQKEMPVPVVDDKTITAMPISFVRDLFAGQHIHSVATVTSPTYTSQIESQALRDAVEQDVHAVQRTIQRDLDTYIQDRPRFVQGVAPSPPAQQRAQAHHKGSGIHLSTANGSYLLSQDDPSIPWMSQAPQGSNMWPNAGPSIREVEEQVALRKLSASARTLSPMQARDLKQDSWTRTHRTLSPMRARDFTPAQAWALNAHMTEIVHTPSTATCDSSMLQTAGSAPAMQVPYGYITSKSGSIDMAAAPPMPSPRMAKSSRPSSAASTNSNVIGIGSPPLTPVYGPINELPSHTAAVLASSNAQVPKEWASTKADLAKVLHRPDASTSHTSPPKTISHTSPPKTKAHDPYPDMW